MANCIFCKDPPVYFWVILGVNEFRSVCCVECEDLEGLVTHLFQFGTNQFGCLHVIIRNYVCVAKHQ